VTTYPLEKAKSKALEQKFRDYARLDAFPRRAGLLREQRYPRATVSFWRKEQGGIAADPAGWDVVRMMGADGTDVFEAQDGTAILRGEQSRDVGGDRWGLYWLLPEPVLAAFDRDAHAPATAPLHSHFLEALLAILPWMIVPAALDLTSVEGAELRRFLERYRYSPVPYPRPSLGKRVERLGRLQYRLSRLEDLLDDTGHVRMPDLLSKDLVRRALPPAPKRRRPITARVWLRLRGEAERPAAEEQITVQWSLKESLTAMARSILELSKRDVELSLQRANQLLSLRSSASITVWAIVTAFFTIFAAIAAAVALLKH
jgi:hypothetical protein